jgi:hypothetical protein
MIPLIIVLLAVFGLCFLLRDVAPTGNGIRHLTHEEIGQL